MVCDFLLLSRCCGELSVIWDGARKHIDCDAVDYELEKDQFNLQEFSLIHSGWEICPPGIAKRNTKRPNEEEDSRINVCDDAFWKQGRCFKRFLLSLLLLPPAQPSNVLTISCCVLIHIMMTTLDRGAVVFVIIGAGVANWFFGLLKMWFAEAQRSLKKSQGSLKGYQLWRLPHELAKILPSNSSNPWHQSKSFDQVIKPIELHENKTLHP